MNNGVYRHEYSRPANKRSRKPVVIGLSIVLLIVLGFGAYKLFVKPSPTTAANRLEFDSTYTEAEMQQVQDAIKAQSKSYSGSMSSHVSTVVEADSTMSVLSAYVPVTNAYAVKQDVTKEEVAKSSVYIPQDTDDKVSAALASTLGVEQASLVKLTGPVEELSTTQIAFVPAGQLSSGVKLLSLDSQYYLDSFQKGAVFRLAAFNGSDATSMDSLKLNSLPVKENVLKVNMSGVTALTRVMQKKLDSVDDPKYFSAKIRDFISDADITHVSNEVSFREGCQYSNTSFCSPPEFIETLKDSGVDLVEITGNHNNDNGSTYNTQSIELYHSLNWGTFGGGLNTDDARKPYVADQKNSKVTFLGYNMADGAGSGAIAGDTTAGANIYNEEKAKADIEAAKQNSQFVIVDIQYAECQAYPSGYVEFPQCDEPIGSQVEDFRHFIDLGADMVIGSSAHQPQTYELYNGKPIYYGLGNLYFEQTQWPGTERGIILTHYFAGGKLLQTKLSPTVYDKDLQTHLMDSADADYLLNRLDDARQSAGL